MLRNENNKFSTSSADNLATCRDELVQLCHLVLPYVDISVVCGARSDVEQNLEYQKGTSKLQYPESKHNVGAEAGRELSDAVDLYIWHPKYGSLTGTNEQLCKIADDFGVSLFRAKTWFHMEYMKLNVLMQTHAELLSIKLRWGGDWNSENGILDQTFDDYFHWEVDAIAVDHT